MIREVKLGDILEYEQPNMYIVKNTNYDKKFSTPVLTAGQSFILGYTNEKENIFKAKENPVIIFDDFTTASKYVDFDFKVKSSAMKILKAREGINIRYVYYAMKNIKFDNQLHKRYWISEYSKIKLLIPNIKMQEKIVKELDLINKLLDYKKKQIELFDDFIKSQFVEMFKKIKRYVELQKVCLFINGDRGENYPSGDKISKNKDGVAFINAGLLESNKVKWSNMNYISEDTYNNLRSGKIQKDDILYCLRGSLGKCAIIDFSKKGAIASSLVILRANKNKINPNFLLIQLGMEEILYQQNQANNGSSQPNLSANSVKKYKILLPPITLQNQFSEIVKQIDKQKFEIEKSLKETQELYDSLMEKYFG